MQGFEVVSNSLKKNGIEYIFAVVGIPVIQLAEDCQKKGVRVICTRNEQSAAYAANAWAYLNAQIGVCLSVGGPGFVNALSGLSNAQANCWPMLLLSGSHDTRYDGMGAFQELEQVEIARKFTKYSIRPPNIESVPYYICRSISIALSGRPGPVYVELPANLLYEKVRVPSSIVYYEPFIESLSEESDLNHSILHKTLQKLKNCRRPLIIFGKGAAYSFAKVSNKSKYLKNIEQFIEYTGIPFIMSPMAKGLISDYHELCVSSARSLALRNSDLILLLGTRPNWMLHFGAKGPRFANSNSNAPVDFINVNIDKELILLDEPVRQGNKVNNDLKSHNLQIHADVSVFLDCLNRYINQKTEKNDFSFRKWRKSLKDKMISNELALQRLCKLPKNLDKHPPLSFYQCLSVIESEIKEHCSPDSIIINEGANTMDIGRTIFKHEFPLCRLDAGTFGTMGIGVGYSIASQIHVYNSDSGARRIGNSKSCNGLPRKVISIQGDSAFGFSCLDFETAARYKLPIVFIVVNNSGIYSGSGSKHDGATFDTAAVPQLKPTDLLPDSRYDFIAKAFHSNGYSVKTVNALKKSLKKCIDSNEPCIINCLIDPSSPKKPQENSWLTSHDGNQIDPISTKSSL